MNCIKEQYDFTYVLYDGLKANKPNCRNILATVWVIHIDINVLKKKNDDRMSTCKNFERIWYIFLF